MNKASTLFGGFGCAGEGAATDALVEGWLSRARATVPTVALADGSDPRAIDAARLLAREGLAEPILVDDPNGFCSPGVKAAAAASRWSERIDLNDPLHVAAAMVSAREADACVAGAGRTTAEVVRAALYCVGLAPGADLVSSCFLMVLADGTPLVFADCGVVPEPGPTQLASIAVASAATYASLTEARPRVAMLSYSTRVSASGPGPERVREAAKLVRRRAPHLDVDGELQFDAAWDAQVAAVKAPNSPVAGRANVFVFPSLEAGNIAYKITERLAGALALGPLLQGTAGVIHDLSRGCSAEDIAGVAVIAACQVRRIESAL